MAELVETPRGNRIHIAFFGLRNAGKSTLVNALTGQSLAIVSDVPGTTTDPVSKAMEILPLGPCLVTDTAGLDDVGALGQQRVEKTLKVLETTDVAIWVEGRARTPGSPRSAGRPESAPYRLVEEACREKKILLLEYHRGDSVEALKAKIAALKLGETQSGLLDGLVRPGDRVVCVVPIDESAPKGRLILPQQQVIRDCLDRHVACVVCQPEELGEIVESLNRRIVESKGKVLVITDSQAFAEVDQTIRRFDDLTSRRFCLTSFSILFARQKGDLAAYRRGLARISELKDGDTVLVAEGCTHHRQCNDIGSVKIPKALTKLTGKKLNFAFASGTDFLDSTIRQFDDSTISLVIQCGGCMLTRREVLRRIALAEAAGIPIVNYGMLLARAAGVDVDSCVACLEEQKDA